MDGEKTSKSEREREREMFSVGIAVGNWRELYLSDCSWEFPCDSKIQRAYARFTYVASDKEGRRGVFPCVIVASFRSKRKFDQKIIFQFFFFSDRLSKPTDLSTEFRGNAKRTRLPPGPTAAGTATTTITTGRQPRGPSRGE